MAAYKITEVIPSMAFTEFFRCQIPNVDVETGIKDKDLPYKALVYSPLFVDSSQSKYRRVDKGSPVNSYSCRHADNDLVFSLFWDERCC